MFGTAWLFVVKSIYCKFFSYRLVWLSTWEIRNQILIDFAVPTKQFFLFTSVFGCIVLFTFEVAKLRFPPVPPAQSCRIHLSFINECKMSCKKPILNVWVMQQWYACAFIKQGLLLVLDWQEKIIFIFYFFVFQFTVEKVKAEYHWTVWSEGFYRVRTNCWW